MIYQPASTTVSAVSYTHLDVYKRQTLAALEKELDKVRRHGIAEDDEEAEIGLKCVAAPIHDEEGHIVAALSVSAPTDRHDPAWIAQVRKTAAAVSQALGYAGTKK